MARQGALGSSLAACCHSASGDTRPLRPLRIRSAIAAATVGIAGTRQTSSLALLGVMGLASCFGPVAAGSVSKSRRGRLRSGTDH